MRAGRRRFLGLAATAVLALPYSVRAAASAAALPKGKRKLVEAAPGRAMDLWTYPARGRRRGTIVFSHGFASSPRFYPDFIAGWTRAGWTVIAPLHVDSDEHPGKATFEPAAIWRTRIEDVRAAVARVHGPYMAAGHSYGGLVALVMGGVEAELPTGLAAPLVPRLAEAVLAFSPPPPMAGLVSAAQYATLKRPLLLQTGTRDVLPSLASDPEGWRPHLAAFAAARPGNDAHAVVLDGVDHYFGGLLCNPAKTGPDQRAALRWLVAASNAFIESRTKAVRFLPSPAAFARLLSK